MGAIVGVIAILIYATIYAAINKDNLDASTESVLSVIPVVLGAVIVISVILTGFAMREG
jgi:hypothetical protein